MGRYVLEVEFSAETDEAARQIGQPAIDAIAAAKALPLEPFSVRLRRQNYEVFGIRVVHPQFAAAG